MTKLKIAFVFALVIVLQACKKDKEVETELINNIPEFYAPVANNYGLNQPTNYLIADESDFINAPQDLDFNTLPSRPNELWVINRGTPETGGSTVMFTNTGKSNQANDYKKDGNAFHFMSMPSALSFNKNGDWATSANILDANHQGGNFTGPTLWSSDLAIYAQYAGPGTNGSHLDMLHGSPYSMGIENHNNNAFWVYDGFNKQIVFYDFQLDHGPGNHDHSDGIIRRYTDFEVKRNPDVPSHMVLDKDKKWLYIVDGGNKRVLRMDVTSGKYLNNLPLYNEELEEHAVYGNTVWEVLIDPSFGLKQPCGIDLKDNRLFISDFETGEIICFDISQKKEIARVNTNGMGIMGIKIGIDGKIYYVNSLQHKVVRLDQN